MSNTKQNTADEKQIMDNLQEKLDFAMFEQEEMDPEKVREILAKMESMDPEADKVKAEFDKDLVWKRIQEQCREEMAEESAVSLEEARMAASGKKKRTNRTASAGKSAKVRRIALSAATIIIALFVGANIGTYATEKKGVIELVSELNNGTAFWVTGDAPSMEVEKDKEVYYSWNDVPNEYKEFLVIPQGLPEDMGLYDIKIWKNDILIEEVIRYIDDEGKRDFSIRIVEYENEEITFANLMYEEGFAQFEQKQIGDIDLCYYKINGDELIAQFAYSNFIYTISGTIDNQEMQTIVEKMIENIF